MQVVFQVTGARRLSNQKDISDRSNHGLSEAFLDTTTLQNSNIRTGQAHEQEGQPLQMNIGGHTIVLDPRVSK